MRDPAGNHKIAYSQDSAIAAILRKILSPVPEKGAKVFRLVVENDYFRLAVIQ